MTKDQTDDGGEAWGLIWIKPVILNWQHSVSMYSIYKLVHTVYCVLPSRSTQYLNLDLALGVSDRAWFSGA